MVIIDPSEYVDIRLSSVELANLVKYYGSCLVGSYIVNIYGDKRRFFLKLRGNIEKRYLVLEPGVRINLTSTVPSVSVSSGFLSQLRKLLRNRRIISVDQYKFDRIVIFTFSSGHKLICELIPRGNLVLTDEEMKIISVLKTIRMRDRSLVSGAMYHFPPNPPSNPLCMPEDKIIEYFEAAKSRGYSLFKLLSGFGLGPKYAWELCHRLGFDCNVKASKLREDATEKILLGLKDLIREVLEAKSSGYVYLRNGKPVMFSPIVLGFIELLGALETLKFNSFNDALDYYYSHTIIEELVRSEVDPLASEKERLLAILETQQKSLQKINEKISRLEKLVSIISDYYNQIEGVLTTIQYAKDQKKLAWDAIREKIEYAKKEGNRGAKLIERISNDGVITFRINNFQVDIFYREKPMDVINKLFQRIKKLKQKLIGTQKALEETKHKIANIENKIQIQRSKETFLIGEAKHEWYYGFRWFFTSENGLLVVGGKDVQTNQTILKKYLDDNDLLLHAEIAGGSVVVLKDATKASSRDIYEAAVYAGSYSKAWILGYNAVDVFKTSKQYISLSPPSHMYLKKGAFLVHSKDIIKNVELVLGIGLRVYIEKPYVRAILVSAPISAISSNAEYYIIIRPGNIKKTEAGKIVRERMVGYLRENYNLDRGLAAKLIRYERVIDLIPGPSTIEGD